MLKPWKTLHAGDAHAGRSFPPLFFSFCAGVQHEALDALWAMCKDEANCAKVRETRGRVHGGGKPAAGAGAAPDDDDDEDSELGVEIDGLTAVARALREHNKCKPVLKKGCGTVTCLAKDELNSALFGKAGSPSNFESSAEHTWLQRKRCVATATAWMLICRAPLLRDPV